MAVDKPLLKEKDKPKKKVVSIKTLKRAVWEVFSKYIRLRDKGKCMTCPAQGDIREMDCGHFQRNSERNQLLGGNELWYFEKNFGCQCTKCNRFNGGEQAEFSLRLEAKYGHGILQEINKLYYTPKLWTVEELLGLKSFYQQKVEELMYQEKGYA